MTPKTEKKSTRKLLPPFPSFRPQKLSVLDPFLGHPSPPSSSSSIKEGKIRSFTPSHTQQDEKLSLLLHSHILRHKKKKKTKGGKTFFSGRGGKQKVGQKEEECNFDLTFFFFLSGRRRRGHPCMGVSQGPFFLLVSLFSADNLLSLSLCLFLILQGPASQQARFSYEERVENCVVGRGKRTHTVRTVAD